MEEREVLDEKVVHLGVPNRDGPTEPQFRSQPAKLTSWGEPPKSGCSLAVDQCSGCTLEEKQQSTKDCTQLQLQQ